jgi:hypothetical protein
MIKTLWSDFLRRVRKDPEWQPPQRLLSMDPGETTGWCLFVEGNLEKCGQLDTKDNYQKTVIEFFRLHQPTHVVCEDYKVYEHKLKQHAWASLHTPQLIGAIKMLAVQYDIPMHLHMAGVAKGFCTDPKLKMWGVYQPGVKHARDAIRHACYYLLFNKGKHNGYQPGDNEYEG